MSDSSQSQTPFARSPQSSKRVYIKIFGLPRSCTNVVQVLIERNFRDVVVLTNTPCWKHGPNTHLAAKPVIQDARIGIDDVRYVVCTKNSYDWLVSFFVYEDRWRRRLPHRSFGFLDFIEKNVFIIRDKLRCRRSTTLRDTGCQCTKSGRTLQQMSFESLLRTQGQVVRDVGSAFGLKPVGVEPKTEPKRIGPNTNEHDDYFARRDAIIITQQLLEVINGHVDPVVLEMAGYRCAEHVCELAALDNLVAAGSDPSGNTTADKEAP